jgi:single-strand DNA-binding protein
MNAVTIIGTLGRPPEIRMAGSSRVANFSIAVHEEFVVQGERKKNTHWIRCVAWGYLADALVGADKGDSVFVAGMITSRSYEKDGQKREQVEVKAEKVVLLPKGERTHAPPDVRAQAPVSRKPIDDDADLPF